MLDLKKVITRKLKKGAVTVSVSRNSRIYGGVICEELEELVIYSNFFIGTRNMSIGNISSQWSEIEERDLKDIDTVVSYILAGCNFKDEEHNPLNDEQRNNRVIKDVIYINNYRFYI